MSSYVLADTNIWHFGLVRPREKEFATMHDLAHRFLVSLLANEAVRIALTSYQVAEILEVLRRSSISSEVMLQVLRDFGKAKFYVKDLSFIDVAKALEDSFTSKIHVYDYLVAYPLKGVVTKIYSADEHFRHPHFTSIAEVVNPLSPWSLMEGKKPEKAVAAVNRRI